MNIICGGASLTSINVHVRVVHNHKPVWPVITESWLWESNVFFSITCTFKSSLLIWLDHWNMQLSWTNMLGRELTTFCCCPSLKNIEKSRCTCKHQWRESFERYCCKITRNWNHAEKNRTAFMGCTTPAIVTRKDAEDVWRSSLPLEFSWIDAAAGATDGIFAMTTYGLFELCCENGDGNVSSLFVWSSTGVRHQYNLQSWHQLKARFQQGVIDS